MTSLAVIFILLLTASLNNFHQRNLKTVTSVKIELQRVLEEFRLKGVEVRSDEKDPLVLLVIIPEDLLNFKYANATIRPEGLEFLQRFAPRLVKTVCAEDIRDSVASIVVEGHADARGSPRGNLDWSQQRASSVVLETLGILGGQPEEEREAYTSCFKRVVSAAGRGDADPVKDPNGIPDPDKSRRVIFKIRIRQAGLELTDHVPGITKSEFHSDG